MKISLPYGDGRLEGELPDSRINGFIESRIDEVRPEVEQGGSDVGTALVREALRTPAGSPRLRELARGKRRITVIISDHTRPVPSKVILPPMLEELREGSPDAEITLLVATGCHRGTTAAELKAKLGEDIFARERIVVHDCADESALVKLGTLPSGGELIINREAAEAELLVAEGFIEPHFFAGFSGGRKSVLPGIASKKTVYANHCSKFISDPRSRAGILEGNPIHRDMVYAARTAGLKFIVNVVINSRREVIGAFAGDTFAAHLAGVSWLETLCASEPIPADIVFTTNNGAPLDQNVYQSVKGMSAGEATCRDGGVIIMAAECADGHGGVSFFNTFAGGDSPAGILRRIEAVPQSETVADQWEAQVLARIMSKHSVVMISSAPDEMIRSFGMTPAHSIEEALAAADRILGRAGDITVIPEGISCVIRPLA